MGIPRLSQWLSATFPDAFSKQTEVAADHVYVDMNEILHKVLQSLGKNPLVDDFIAALHERLDNIFKLVTPQQTVYLAVDGAAPAAKIFLQRQRRRQRAQSVPPINKNKRGRGQGKQIGPNTLATNMLTPGVPIMAKITTAIEEYCILNFGLRGALAGRKHKSLPGGIRAIVSGADRAGEGEHKILAATLRNCSVGKGSHLIIGSDSDLLVLFLGQRGMSRVKVMSMFPRKILHVCDMGTLGRCLQNYKNVLGTATLKPTPCTTMHPPDDKELGLRRDFVLVTLLRGNDYLPPLDCDYDPANLWLCYLRWRRKQFPELGIVSKANEDVTLGADTIQINRVNTAVEIENLALRREQLISFMEFCAGSQSLISPVGAPDAITVQVSTYLNGLLWCLTTYTTGSCPDLTWSLPRNLTVGACAKSIAEHAPVLAAEQLETNRKPSSSLGPLTVAMAVLPVSEVRNLIFPFAPCLAHLLESDGMLANVACLETCAKCKMLEESIAAAPAGSKKGLKRKKAFESHRQQHSDIDTVDFAALDAEVRRLCQNAPAPEASRLVPLLTNAPEPEALAGSVVVSKESSHNEAEEEEEEEEGEEEEEEHGDVAGSEEHDEIASPSQKRARLNREVVQTASPIGHTESLGRLGSLAQLLSRKPHDIPQVSLSV